MSKNKDPYKYNGFHQLIGKPRKSQKDIRDERRKKKKGGKEK